MNGMKNKQVISQYPFTLHGLSLNIDEFNSHSFEIEDYGKLTTDHVAKMVANYGDEKIINFIVEKCLEAFETARNDDIIDVIEYEKKLREELNYVQSREVN